MPRRKPPVRHTPSICSPEWSTKRWWRAAPTRSAGYYSPISKAGKKLPQDTREAVAHYAVKLAEATGQPAWLDLLFRIYGADAAPLPLEAVDALYRLLRRVRGTSRSLLKAYLERLHDRTPGFGPAERFAVKRTEGLLQIMAD